MCLRARRSFAERVSRLVDPESSSASWVSGIGWSGRRRREYLIVRLESKGLDVGR